MDSTGHGDRGRRGNLRDRSLDEFCKPLRSRVESQPMPTTPRRRWFQFGLREMFWLLLVVALASFGVREHRERIRERGELEWEIK